MELIVRHDYDVLANTLLQINKNFTGTRGFCVHLDSVMGIHLVGIKSFSSTGGKIKVVWLADIEEFEDDFVTHEISSTLTLIDAEKCVGEISFEVKKDGNFNTYLCATKVYNYFLEVCKS
nr:MAG TPA: hypothetical protein [Caudoviricetes sp.]